MIKVHLSSSDSLKNIPISKSELHLLMWDIMKIHDFF